jgi:hypothetical protein
MASPLVCNYRSSSLRASTKPVEKHCGAYPATIAAVAEVADVSPVTVRTHRGTLDELAV